MATATLPLEWKGRSGRVYVPVPRARVRHGQLATVRKVVGKGPPVGTSTIPEGQPLAMKAWIEGDDEAALEVLQAEARILQGLMGVEGDLPCPRLYDLVGEPVVAGIIMEWCPGDLERWWRDKLSEPDAFGRLMATMAEVARRVSDYHVFHAEKGGLEPAHGDLKPGNILLSAQGRWLLSDFGSARVRPPEDSPWASSDIVLGTENFLAPEVLFHASRSYPTAVDTWALGAVLFALLRLRSLVEDGEVIPRNGTVSPRFRSARMAQVLDVYRKDPSQFMEQDLDAEAFPTPLRLPDADRKSVREALRGIFGTEDAEREEAVAEPLLDLLDRCLSIDPKHRYTAARDLAAAFEALTRRYIELSASIGGTPPAQPERKKRPEARPPATSEEQPTEKAPVVDAEILRLRARLREAEARLAEVADQEDTEPMQPLEAAPPARNSPIVIGLLVMLLVLQGLTLLVVALVAGMTLSAG